MSDWACAKTSTPTARIMMASTGKVVIERTVPVYCDHNQTPSGLYSQMIGLFALSFTAQFVSLSSCCGLQPGVDGMPSSNWLQRGGGVRWRTASGRAWRTGEMSATECRTAKRAIDIFRALRGARQGKAKAKANPRQKASRDSRNGRSKISAPQVWSGDYGVRLKGGKACGSASPSRRGTETGRGRAQ